MDESAAPSASSATQSSEDNLEKKNKPKATKLRQQKLPAWQPILTASTVIPAFAIVGIVFVPIGVILLSASNGVNEFSIDYTSECLNDLGQDCEKITADKGGLKCKCYMDITLEKDFTGDVYFYYGLKNYYQNHRRYVKSRNDEQLLGKLTQTSDCAPYDKLENGTGYAPCGAIANSLFNDTYSMTRVDDGGEHAKLEMTDEGVVWPVDRRQKFKNPGQSDDSYPTPAELQKSFSGYLKPPDWGKQVWELDTENPENNGFLNTDFIVWMRTSALPNFRKLYRKLNRSGVFSDGMPKGNYTLTVDYNYPVSSFSGRKLFIISTTSWAGAKNNFLGIAYIVVGSLCIVMGIVFLVIHLKFGKSLTDISAVRGGAA